VVPVSEALRRVETYEREGLAILGLEAARITGDEKVLLPAIADFSGSSADESWAFARQVLADDLPTDATHVSFVPQLTLGPRRLSSYQGPAGGLCIAMPVWMVRSSSRAFSASVFDGAGFADALLRRKSRPMKRCGFIYAPAQRIGPRRRQYRHTRLPRVKDGHVVLVACDKRRPPSG
jgi:hypothetical protein